MAKKQNSAGVLPLTPANVLTSLLKKFKRSKNQVDEINSEMGESTSNAVEHHHLNRPAFNIVKRLFVMPDEKLANVHHFLMAYLDTSGINERVEKVGRLPLGDDDENKNVVSMKAAE